MMKWCFGFNLLVECRFFMKLFLCLMCVSVVVFMWVIVCMLVIMYGLLVIFML